MRQFRRWPGFAVGFPLFAVACILMLLAPHRTWASEPDRSELVKALEKTRSAVLAGRAKAMVTGTAAAGPTAGEPGSPQLHATYEWAYAGKRSLYQETWSAQVFDGSTWTIRRWDQKPPWLTINARNVSFAGDKTLSVAEIDPEFEAYGWLGPNYRGQVIDQLRDPHTRLSVGDGLIWLDWDDKSGRALGHHRIGLDPAHGYVIRERRDVTATPGGDSSESSFRLLSVKKVGNIWLPGRIAVASRYQRGQTVDESDQSYVISGLSSDVPDSLFVLGKPGDTVFDNGATFRLGPHGIRVPFVHRRGPRRPIFLPEDRQEAKRKALIRFVAELAFVILAWFTVKALLKRRRR